VKLPVPAAKKLTTPRGLGFKFQLDLKNGSVIPEEGVTQHQLRKQYDKLTLAEIQKLNKLQKRKGSNLL